MLAEMTVKSRGGGFLWCCFLSAVVAVETKKRTQTWFRYENHFPRTIAVVEKMARIEISGLFRVCALQTFVVDSGDQIGCCCY